MPNTASTSPVMCQPLLLLLSTVLAQHISPLHIPLFSSSVKATEKEEEEGEISKRTEMGAHRNLLPDATVSVGLMHGPSFLAPIGDQRSWRLYCWPGQDHKKTSFSVHCKNKHNRDGISCVIISSSYRLNKRTGAVSSESNHNLLSERRGSR